MKFKQLSVGQLGTNGFVLYQDKDAVFIDPGAEPERFIQHIENKSLNLRAILITHGHGDHIGAVKELRTHYPKAEVICHREDASRLTNPNKNFSHFIGLDLNVGPPDRTISNLDNLTFGSIELEVRHVPGHTPGHVVFIAGKDVFAGDTIFAGGVGRWDLPGGDGTLLFKSIREQLLTLPDDYTIWPGHGPSTTIGEEKHSNPYFDPSFNPDAIGW